MSLFLQVQHILLKFFILLCLVNVIVNEQCCSECSEDTGKKELRLQNQKDHILNMFQKSIYFCLAILTRWIWLEQRKYWTLWGFDMYLVFLGKIFLSVPCWQFPIKLSNQMFFFVFFSVILKHLTTSKSNLKLWQNCFI